MYIYIFIYIYIYVCIYIYINIYNKSGTQIQRTNVSLNTAGTLANFHEEQNTIVLQIMILQSCKYANQGLIVFGTCDRNFRTYFQFEFLIIYKHIHASYNVTVMIKHFYNTPPPMESLYY